MRLGPAETWGRVLGSTHTHTHTHREREREDICTYIIHRERGKTYVCIHTERVRGGASVLMYHNISHRTVIWNIEEK